MHNPRNLSFEQLAELAIRLQKLLFGARKDNKRWIYSLDKEISGADVHRDVVCAIDSFGLAPTTDGNLEDGVGEVMDSKINPRRKYKK